MNQIVASQLELMAIVPITRLVAMVLMHSISHKDCSELKKIISPETLENVESVDEDINRFFSYCCKINVLKESLVLNDPKVSGGGDGLSTKVTCIYSFDMENSDYILYFIYVINNENKKKQGLKSIKIVKEKDRVNFLQRNAFEDMEQKLIILPEE